MTWVAVAVAGGAIIGGALSAQGSKSAANIQAGAANQATQAQLGMFQQTQTNLAPYMQEGQIGLNQINQMMPQFTQPFTLDQFQTSPAYQFNLQQGQQAIDKAAASRNMYYAPQTLQDLGKYQQGLASNEFQNAFGNYQTNLNNIWSRLYGLTGTGANAAANLGGFGTTVGGQIGSNITGAGNAQAAGTVGQANAVQNALGQGMNAYFMNQLLTQQDPYAAGTVGPNFPATGQYNGQQMVNLPIGG